MKINIHDDYEIDKKTLEVLFDNDKNIIFHKSFYKKMESLCNNYMILHMKNNFDEWWKKRPKDFNKNNTHNKRILSLYAEYNLEKFKKLFDDPKSEYRIDFLCAFGFDYIDYWIEKLIKTEDNIIHYLSVFHKDKFDIWFKYFEKNLYKQPRYLSLLINCSDQFDKWWNPKKFHWSDYSYYLPQFCSDHFDKWWDPERFKFNEGMTNQFKNHCRKYKDIWEPYCVIQKVL